MRTAPSEEDPALLFYSANPALVTVTIDADTVGSEPAALLAAALPSNFGGYVGLAISGVQDAGAGAIKATISVDLNLKE